MDPVSAIGVASGAITFLQASYQFVRAVYDAYDDSKPAAFETLGDVAELMNNQSSDILSQNKDLPLFSSDVAIAVLATHCHTLSTSIVKRVQQAKGRSGSLRSAISSAVKTLVHKGEIARLQAGLDNCRAQLHLQFHLSSR